MIPRFDISARSFLLVLTTTLCAGVVNPPSVMAKPTTPENATKKAFSDQRLREASAALDAKDYNLASQRIREAYEATQSPESLFLFGQLALAEGRKLEARDFMRRVLTDPLQEKDAPENAEARKILAAPAEPYGEIDIQGDRGTLIKVDGRLRGAVPLSSPLIVAPGEHTIDLSRGSRRLEEKVRVPVGRLAEVRYNLSARTLLINLLPAVVIIPTFSGLPNDAQARMRETIEATVFKERYSPLTRQRPPLTAGCSDIVVCEVEQARKLDAELILHVRASKQRDGVQLGMDIIDVAIGDMASTQEKRCAGCNADRAASELAAFFPLLLNEAATRPRGQLRVRSNPSGAAVLIDGRRVGLTPYDRPAWVGPHTIVLKLDGFEDVPLAVEVKENETAEAQSALRERAKAAVANVAPPPVTPVVVSTEPKKTLPRPLWRIVTGSVLIGGGLIMLGLGAASAAQSKSCPDAAAGCSPGLLSVENGGAVASVGAWTAIGGAVLIAIPESK